MRRLGLLLATLCALLLGTPAAVRAAESKCPLPLTECMLQYAELRDRGWLGIEVERDTTTNVATIVRVVPGGPADQAGWKDAKPVQVAVLRAGASVTVPVQCGVIPEDYLAHMIGVHVLEGHLAYMDKAE